MKNSLRKKNPKVRNKAKKLVWHKPREGGPSGDRVTGSVYAADRCNQMRAAK